MWGTYFRLTSMGGGGRDVLTSVKRSVRIIYERGRMVLIAGNGVKRTVYR